MTQIKGLEESLLGSIVLIMSQEFWLELKDSILKRTYLTIINIFKEWSVMIVQKNIFESSRHAFMNPFLKKLFCWKSGRGGYKMRRIITMNLLEIWYSSSSKKSQNLLWSSLNTWASRVLVQKGRNFYYLLNLSYYKI